MSKRVVVDCDGVLCEFNRPFWELLNSHCPMNPLPKDGPEQWDWFPVHGATEQAQKKAWEQATPKWWGSLPPFPEFTKPARERLEDIAREAEVSFVTARPCGRDATAAWLKMFVPGLGQYPQVTVTPKRKIMALIGMEPHIIIEDNAPTLAHYAAAEKDYNLPKCLKILVARPYNRSWQAVMSSTSEDAGYAVALTTEEAMNIAYHAIKESK